MTAVLGIWLLGGLLALFSFETLLARMRIGPVVGPKVLLMSFALSVLLLPTFVMFHLYLWYVDRDTRDAISGGIRGSLGLHPLHATPSQDRVVARYTDCVHVRPDGSPCGFTYQEHGAVADHLFHLTACCTDRGKEHEWFEWRTCLRCRLPDRLPPLAEPAEAVADSLTP